MPVYALEATCLAQPRATGIARYGRELALGLDALVGDDEQVRLLYRSSRYRHRGLLPAGRHLQPALWHRKLWPLRRPYDLVHALDHRLPDWQGPARLATVYDIYSVLGIGFDRPGDRERQNAIYRDFAARCERLIFISDSTRRDFFEHIGYDAARSHVIHLGVSDEFRRHDETELAPLRKRLNLDRPYLLFLGLSNPNKNLPRLLEAFAGSAARRSHRLLIAGQLSDEAAPILQAAVARLGIADAVSFPGYLPAADIPRLYAGAAAFLFPSLCEGFGLPILEAMACGTPVLTSAVSSCPEVAAGHAVLVDPLDVAAIGAGIDRVLTMSPSQCEAARLHAVAKTWRQTVEQTLAVYRLIVAERGARA